nr:hypothetical protein CFP56_04854 [Quercus suber]
MRMEPNKLNEKKFVQPQTNFFTIPKIPYRLLQCTVYSASQKLPLRFSLVVSWVYLRIMKDVIITAYV